MVARALISMSLVLSWKVTNRMNIPPPRSHPSSPRMNRPAISAETTCSSVRMLHQLLVEIKWSCQQSPLQGPCQIFKNKHALFAIQCFRKKELSHFSTNLLRCFTLVLISPTGFYLFSSSVLWSGSSLAHVKCCHTRISTPSSQDATILMSHT